MFNNYNFVSYFSPSAKLLIPFFYMLFSLLICKEIIYYILKYSYYKFISYLIPKAKLLNPSSPILFQLIL